MLLSLVLMTFLMLASCLQSDYNDVALVVGRQKLHYNPGRLSEERLLEYSSLKDTNNLRDEVNNILLPRVSGSVNNTKVRNYIVNTLRHLDWHVDLNSFEQTVPILGQLEMTNIIATLNANAERYLVLACHYDTKYITGFLGATDSAVPCAIMLNMAHVLQQQFNTLRKANKLSLMMLFFDGEEAFKEWSRNDSIYGSRHLAANWEQQNLLERIDIFMLLDILGATYPKIYSYFSDTNAWFKRLIVLERRLERLDVLKRNVTAEPLRQRYFNSKTFYNLKIEDDHLPFLERNVPILHIIPKNFPKVWHTIGDNADIIDYITTENIALILRCFTLEYLLPELDNQ